MRYPSDMPRPPRRRRKDRERKGGPNRGRILLGVAIVAIVLLLLSLRAIATFWTDYLWYDSLSQTSVWSRLLSAKITLGVATGLIFFVLLWVNLVIADRLAPRFRSSVGAEEELLVRYRELVGGRQRLVWLVVALVVAAVPGFSASAQWREWLLFRYGGSFGIDDPQFNADVGFYVFKLPFLTTVVDWLFGFLLVTAVIVALVHYLNGAIRIQPLGERVTPNAKAHLSILLALAAFTKAVDYWLRRFELTTSTGTSFDGAGYTDVHASLPAIQLMILISLFAGVLLLVNIRRSGWALPVIILASWVIIGLIAGGIYPAFVQRFQVSPSELAKEEPYIERNITATRAALGLENVRTQEFDYEPLIDQDKLDADRVNIRNARLLDPAVILPTFQNLQFTREYHAFRDVDVDRYVIEDEVTPVVVSARELNLNGVVAPNWEKLHMVYTHGYAGTLAPANSVDSVGRPNFLIRDIPARVADDTVELERPEIYHGEQMDGYAIVGTNVTETSTDDVTTAYEGRSGVSIGSVVRRAAFALRFGEIEPLISSNLTDESRVIFHRDVVERVQALAPFLEIDGDPYPIFLDGGVKYVVDAYTTTTQYPYAQSVDAAAVSQGASGSFNYLRNSVKAVVDAYDGTVTMYLADTLYGAQDPIIRAYAKAFPGLFTDEIPPELMEHLRYPEFMFKAQTTVWGRYHQTSPSTFFNNTDRWAVGQQPPDRTSTTGDADVDEPVGGSQQPRIEPYYQYLRIGEAEEPEFVVTRPFVLASGDDTGRSLPAIMVARSDPGSYGQLEQVVMSGEGDGDGTVDGPLQANQKMVTYGPFAEYQTNVGRSGSRVRLGNMLILPFQNSLLYLRPVYAAEESSGRFLMQRVVVVSGERIGFGETIEAALSDLLDRDDDRAVDRPSGENPTEPDEPIEGEGGGTTTTTVPGADQRTAAELLQEASDLIARASELLGQAPTSTTPTTTPGG